MILCHCHRIQTLVFRRLNVAVVPGSNCLRDDECRHRPVCGCNASRFFPGYFVIGDPSRPTGLFIAEARYCIDYWVWFNTLNRECNQRIVKADADQHVKREGQTQRSQHRETDVGLLDGAANCHRRGNV